MTDEKTKIDNLEITNNNEIRQSMFDSPKDKKQSKEIKIGNYLIGINQFF